MAAKQTKAAEKRCPNCGACKECGAPQPQVIPMPYPVYPWGTWPHRPQPMPGTNPYPWRPYQPLTWGSGQTAGGNSAIYAAH